MIAEIMKCCAVVELKRQARKHKATIKAEYLRLLDRADRREIYRITHGQQTHRIRGERSGRGDGLPRGAARPAERLPGHGERLRTFEGDKAGDRDAGTGCHSAIGADVCAQ